MSFFPSQSPLGIHRQQELSSDQNGWREFSVSFEVICQYTLFILFLVGFHPRLIFGYPFFYLISLAYCCDIVIQELLDSNIFFVSLKSFDTLRRNTLQDTFANSKHSLLLNNSFQVDVFAKMEISHFYKTATF